MRPVVWLLLGVMTAAGPHQFTPRRRATTSVTLRSPAEVVLSIRINDIADAVSSYSVIVDGEPDSDILIFPITDRTTFSGLVGPLSIGAHTFELRPSSHWKAIPPEVIGLQTRVVNAGDLDADAIRYAPALWMRPDTIGTETDLPLVLYAEIFGSSFQYSAIFSNEDGGTPTRALLARWGRTTDIEWVYRAEVPRPRATTETYQASDHEAKAFAGDHRGLHPLLFVATTNNLFAETGTSVALVRMVPRMVDLTNQTRESVMDLEPWTYVIMHRELAAEGKIAADQEPLSGMTRVYDPRNYLYLEARVVVDHAEVSASAIATDAGVFTSHGGDAELWIARSGWVRTAVATGRRPIASVTWSCAAQSGVPVGDARATCDLNATRAFRLREDLTVGPNLIAPREIRLGNGESVTIPVLPEPGK